MAFEAFLTQEQVKPTGRRRLTYTLSLLVHGALVVVGVVYSFWHVEELSPPTVRVTFLSAMPPPPPPPPPAGGNGGAKKRIVNKPKPTVTPTLVQPKQTLVQPKEKPVVEEKKPPKEDPEPKKKPNDDDDDDALPGGVVGGTKGGVAGGTIGGTVGGTVGGVVDAPVAAKILPPQMGKKQKLSGDPPAFPVALRRAGTTYVVMAKICVGKTGAVDGVTIMKKADPQLDASVVDAVKTWRHSPLLANNTPVPFCYFERFEFKAD